MAWKRSSVRSRPGPPSFQVLADILLFLVGVDADLTIDFNIRQGNSALRKGQRLRRRPFFFRLMIAPRRQ
jgi:hypothetical protein